MTYTEAREAADRSRAARMERARGGRADEEQDRREIASAVHKHERHDHKGEPLTKLKGGGKVEGRARGGRLDRAGKKPVTVNVIVAGGGQSAPHPVPVPVPAGGPPAAIPPRPMGASPVAGLGPMPPGMPPRARGGRMTAGAASGEGRLEKERMVER